MTRSITVLYFAAVREAAGKSEERVELPDTVRTISDLGGFLEQRSTGLRGRLSSVRFAVDEAFAEPDTPLAGGEVVALIPPVSGG